MTLIEILIKIFCLTFKQYYLCWIQLIQPWQCMHIHFASFWRSPRTLLDQFNLFYDSWQMNSIKYLCTLPNFFKIRHEYYLLYYLKRIKKALLPWESEEFITCLIRLNFACVMLSIQNFNNKKTNDLIWK